MLDDKTGVQFALFSVLLLFTHTAFLKTSQGLPGFKRSILVTIYVDDAMSGADLFFKTNIFWPGQSMC